MDTRGCGVVVLAGGRGSRLGGVVKPGLAVGGRTMLSRVLDATAGWSPRVVVGPDAVPLPEGVFRTVESPPGGGPVAGAAAGLSTLVEAAPEAGLVVLLAGDLPLLGADAVAALITAVRGTSDVDGACFVDPDGRRQLLCGVWRVAALAGSLAGIEADRGDVAGASMRALFAGLRVLEMSWDGAGAPPWFDCDTEEDLRRAETWVSRES
ncbi:molybdenum cofactor guanylyltransferase [Catenuloplanes sp. NPDC051500]|uniref:molybdenum cofactor guanylyltransferase n=1 Tax=Catenuloplanes sp. NPDC051500 TaxID=3363959 RepID=UPI0037A4FDBD